MIGRYNTWKSCEVSSLLLFHVNVKKQREFSLFCGEFFNEASLRVATCQAREVTIK